MPFGSKLRIITLAREEEKNYEEKNIKTACRSIINLIKESFFLRSVFCNAGSGGDFGSASPGAVYYQYGDLSAGRGSHQADTNSDLVMLVMVAGVEAVQKLLYYLFWSYDGSRIERDMRMVIFGHYQKLSFTFYE